MKTQVKVLLVSILFLCLQSYGDIMISNLDHVSGSPWSISETKWTGGSFTVGNSNYQLNTITFLLDPFDIDLGALPQGSTPVVSIYSDNQGVPDLLLESISVTQPTSGLNDFISTGLELQSNKTYWIMKSLEGTGAYTSIDYFIDAQARTVIENNGWVINENSLSTIDEGQNWIDDSSWRSVTYSINATAIPEPSSAILAIISSVGILAWRRRFRR